jgi:hypothetical protein
MTLKTAFKHELDARQKYLIAAEGNDNTRTDLAKNIRVTCLVFSSQFHLEALAPLVDLFFHSDMNSTGVL